MLGATTQAIGDENLAIRQMLGHVDLPEFVGDIDGEAPYQAQ